MNRQKKFWRWTKNKRPDPNENETRTLYLDGVIAEESWFDDEVTPALFKSELDDGTGNITVWINSPGGDCFAAAQIYNLLLNYQGKVTVKIDGLAASAASVIAMVGDEILMSPVSMLMIHNPSTVAIGDTQDMQRAIGMLSEVKESIIGAYKQKSGLSHAKLASLMDEETWMNAEKAVELHFADRITSRQDLYPQGENEDPTNGESAVLNGKESESLTETPMLFSRRKVVAAINKKLCDYAATCEAKTPDQTAEPITHSYKVKDLETRLDLIKHFI